jgi:hypothetical protein
MKWPHDKYVITLLCGKMSFEDIASEMLRWALPYDQDRVHELHKELEEKDPEYFKNGLTTEIKYDVLKEYKIEDMYGYFFERGVEVATDHLENTFHLLENRHLRTLLFSTILAGMSSDEIELILNEKYDNINTSSASVDAFIHYFFNLEGFSFKEKESLEKSFAKDVKIRRAFRDALKNDRDYMLWKLGAAPQKSFDAMIKDLFVDTVYLFKEFSKDKKIDEVSKLGTLAVRLSDRLEKYEETNKKADDIFSEFSLEPAEIKASEVSTVTAEDIGVNETFVFSDEENENSEIIPPIDDGIVMNSEDYLDD